MRFKVTAAGDAQIMVERHFAASADAVVKAFLEPDMVMRWMSAPGMPMVVAELDPRPGGRFRYGWEMPDNQRMWLTGMFTDMGVATNGDRWIEHTELFDPDWTGGETTERVDYISQDGGTLVRSVITYPTPATRDMVLAGDMLDGMQGGYDRLDAVLAAG